MTREACCCFLPIWGVSKADAGWRGEPGPVHICAQQVPNQARRKNQERFVCGTRLRRWSAGNAALARCVPVCSKKAKTCSQTQGTRTEVHHSAKGIEGLMQTISVFLSGLGLCCLQGGVFLLQDSQGHPDPDKVLKATFKLSLGGIAGMTHMEREWAVGRRLAPLEKLDKALPGFMATGAAVLTRAGSFRGVQHRQLCLTTACNYACHIESKGMHQPFSDALRVA